MAAEIEPALRKILGRGHLATLRVLVINARAANSQSNPRAGERYAREVLAALKSCAESLPEISKPAAIALAESLDLQGRNGEARAVLDDAIEQAGGFEGRLAVVNSQLAIAYASHLARTGRLEDARAFMTRVADDAEAIMGGEHPAARNTRAFLNALETPDE